VTVDLKSLGEEARTVYLAVAGVLEIDERQVLVRAVLEGWLRNDRWALPLEEKNVVDILEMVEGQEAPSAYIQVAVASIDYMISVRALERCYRLTPICSRSAATISRSRPISPFSDSGGTVCLRNA